MPHTRRSQYPSGSAQLGRVGMWRGSVRSTMSVAAPFVWRCLSGSAITPFPHPAHRTQHTGKHRLVTAHPRSGHSPTLLNHFVGAGEDRWRHGEAKRIRGLEIDDQLERSRLLDRQIGRIGALEDLLSAKGDFPVKGGQPALRLILTWQPRANLHHLTRTYPTNKKATA
jgi:hypothetical protein